MAFNYSILANIQLTQNPSASVYTNTAPTASYIRTIVVNNLTGSADILNVWLVPSGSTAATTTNRLISLGVSASAGYVLEFNPPGIMLTQSNASIYVGSNMFTGGSNFMILGGIE